MGRSGIWLFIAGLLVVASVGACVLLHDKAKRVEAERIAARDEDAERIEQLEAQLRLAQAEVSEYREKLDDAERIAGELEAERDARTRLAVERAARIEALERDLEALAEPVQPDEPVVASFTEPDTTAGAGGQDGPDGTVETLLAEDLGPGAGDHTPAVSGTEPSTGTTPTEPVGTGEVEVATGEVEVATGEVEVATTAGTGPESDLEREIEELRAEKRELERKHAALLGEEAGGVPIGEVKVSTGLRVKGKVLVVNDRYNFVVVDVGARDGIEKGMVLIVHRDKRFIGKCQVEKVYNDKAAADLVLDWLKDDVLVGDGVRKF